MDPLCVEHDEDEMRLDRWFALKFPNIGHGQLQRWLRSGQVRLDGKRVKSGARLQSGQTVRIPPFLPQFEQNQLANEPSKQAKRSQERHQTRTLSAAEQRWLEDMCLFQDDSLVILNKPAGLAVQGGEKIRQPLDQLARAWGESLYGKMESEQGNLGLRLVHRLDRETSGLIVLANGRRAAARLSRAFASRKVSKTYLALVAGKPRQDSGEITAPLAKLLQPNGQERMGIDRVNGQPALTEFDVLDHAGARATLLQLEPKTGRTHQIRAHCALALKCPIIGDEKYSGRDAALQIHNSAISRAANLYLHSWRLSFAHPNSGKQVEITAPLPREFRDVLKFLGLTHP